MISMPHNRFQKLLLVSSFNLCFLVAIGTRVAAQEQTVQVDFTLTLKGNTPLSDFIGIYVLDGNQKFRMDKIGDSTWHASIGLLPHGMTAYKYDRNNSSPAADEEWNGRDQGLRSLNIVSGMQSIVIKDTVYKWRWWPANGVVPQIDTSTFLSTPPAKLPPKDFRRGISLLDYWDDNYTTFVAPTLDNIVKNTNANWIMYYPIIEFKQWFPMPTLDGSGVNHTPDDKLILIINESHKRGLKVSLWPFTSGSRGVDTMSGKHSLEWWLQFYQQWNVIMKNYAQICQDYNVESLSFSPSPGFADILGAPEVPIADSLSRQLMSSLRQIYKGSIGVEGISNFPTMKIHGDGDFIWRSLNEGGMSNTAAPSVADILSYRAGGSLQSMLDLNRIVPEMWGKKFVLQGISATSMHGAINGAVYWDSNFASMPDDPNVPLDLQIQATMYEAYFRAITANDWIIGANSFGYNYWDSIDKTPTIRSKPAENVFAKWAGWIQQSTTLATPLRPTLAAPADSAKSVSISPSLSWSASTSATSYRVQVSTSASFAPVILDDSTLTTTSRQVGPLSGLTVYYWRARAQNSGGASFWSPVRSFTTTLAAPQAPTLAAPADSTKNVQLSTTLSWNATAGATSYRLQLSTTPTFASAIIDDSTLTTTSRAIGPLTLATTYYWCVSAKNSGGYGAFSPVRQFSTIRTTLVEQVSIEIPKDFALRQNYPNPFNPATTIQFALPKRNHVTLKVFDALGKEVETLVSNEFEPGYFSVRWQANVPSGIYFYRLQAGEYEETKKLVVLK